ncbi:sigma 54-interacting transcriptional regulator [Pendulispora albinea]|uniref:Sigma 54-interacting transcriptional regulator n=1 Tax=Pendulispora albinea TaxID=2741071 RepID=A0ABZ2LRI1_9BACT
MDKPIRRLVVAHGPNSGAHLLVGASLQMVGRGRGADFMLDDMAVSRQHFHVVASDEGVHIHVCDEATPLMHAGHPIREGDVKIGESIVVGNTVLFVEDVGIEESVSLAMNDDATTTVQSLLSGTTVDVQGLAAIFSLNENLAETGTAGALEEALRAWAKVHALCHGVEIDLAPGGAKPHADETIVVTKAEGRDCTKISVPAHGAPAGRVTFTTSVAAHLVTDSLRRLLILAGALSGARLAQLSTLHAIDEDRKALRQLAVGSARAFLGSSPAAARVIDAIPKLAISSTTVLLLGETGVGKSFLARLIHESSPRKEKPFHVINCAAIPESLAESELFGHERGAFSGAIATKQGALEAVGDGTLLLDEIGELPLASQAKLLRVLEDKRFERLGSPRSLPLRARVITATNRDLEAMVRAGTFRSDLLFRISVVPVFVPPLREREEDLVLLAKHILVDLGQTSPRRIDGFSMEAIAAIRDYPWPGNVRELRNAIEHAVVLGDDPWIKPSDLPLTVRRLAIPTAEHESDAFLVRLPANLEWLKQLAIRAAMQATGGNVTKAAALLGVNRNTLYYNKS